MRPATTSRAARITASFSSGAREAFSPSIDRTITPDTPFSTRRLMLACVAARSTEPSCRILVVAAGKTPVHRFIAIAPAWIFTSEVERQSYCLLHPIIGSGKSGPVSTVAKGHAGCRRTGRGPNKRRGPRPPSFTRNGWAYLLALTLVAAGGGAGVATICGVTVLPLA